MTISLKIEILKILNIEFSFSSEKKEKEEDAKTDDSPDLLNALK